MAIAALWHSLCGGQLINCDLWSPIAAGLIQFEGCGETRPLLFAAEKPTLAAMEPASAAELP